MAYTRKTKDEYHVEVNYGYGDGWECVHTEDTFKEVRQRVQEYRKESPQYPVRWAKKRVPIVEEV